MDKLDQLFIRACKVENSEKRLQSVYRRFYLPYEQSTVQIIPILARIIDENLSYKVVDILTDMSPSSIKVCESMTYYEKCLSVLISKIRYANINEFDGLTRPLKFK
jgi:hypothetical protein